MSKKIQTQNTNVKSLYGLKDPAQVKLRIIWQHVQAITLKVHGNTPENVNKLRGYDKAFSQAEKEENKAVK